MRICVWLYIFLCLSSPAFAYVEENNAGMAEMSAGDQNTNMYKLNSRTDYLVKKLKKIDEYASKKGNDTPFLNVSDIEDISVMEQKDREKQQNKKFLEEIVKTAATPQNLKESVKPDVFMTLLSINEVKDAGIAAELQRQINGARRR